MIKNKRANYGEINKTFEWLNGGKKYYLPP